MNRLLHFYGRFPNSIKALTILLILACGPGPADYNEFMSYFMPESAEIKAKTDTKYLFTPQFYYKEPYFSAEKNDEQGDNRLSAFDAQVIADWAKLYGNKVKTADIEQYFFGSGYRYNDEFVAPFTANAFSKYVVDTDPEAGKYLFLLMGMYKAKENDDTLARKRLLSQAQYGLKNTKTAFLRERYALQTIRLCRLTQQYNWGIQVYLSEIAQQNKLSTVGQWCRDAYAGLLYAKGEKGKAFFHFAQVFADAPSLRESAETSIRGYVGKEAYQDAIKFCSTNSERANVYAIAAIQPSIDGLELLKKVVELDPKNSLTELIMAREINKNETYFFQENYTDENYTSELFFFENSDYLKERIDNAPSYIEKLEAFAEKCTKNPKLNPAFWHTCQAYLAYLAHNYTGAHKALNAAKSLPTNNPSLKAQITTQELLMSVEQCAKIDTKFEQQTIGGIEQLANSYSFRENNTLVKTCMALARMYQGLPNTILSKTSSGAGGGWLSGCSKPKLEATVAVEVSYAKAKAYLMNALCTGQVRDREPSTQLPYYFGFNGNKNLYEIEDSTDAQTIVEVIKYMEAPNKTDFDIRFQKLFNLDIHYFHVLLGRRFLAEHQYAQAAMAFGKIKPDDSQNGTLNGYLNENPFYLAPNNGENPTQKYTPQSFAQRMHSLETEAKAGSAQAWYLMGCGAFNITYWGNSWILSRRQWSSTEANNNYMRKSQQEKLTYDDYYTALLAQTYLENGLKIAKDPELTAKITYALAQYESLAYLNAYYSDYPNYSDYPENDDYENATNAYEKMMKEKRKKGLYNKYFSTLRNKYQRTKYQQMVLDECSSYRDFVGK